MERIVNITQTLLEAGFDAFLIGSSALDTYYGLQRTGIEEIATNADLISLSRLFEEIEFPASETADAVIITEDTWHLIRIISDDMDRELELYGFLPHSSFWYDCSRKFFRDPGNIYWDLRSPGSLSLPNEGEIAKNRAYIIADAAVLLSRYEFTMIKEDIDLLHKAHDRPGLQLSAFEQQLLLRKIGLSKHPWKGMDLLMKSGFIDEHWPLLAKMRGVEQNKEFHPEGDVWDHTLETFRYIKKPDFQIFTALLLHDSGKPFSRSEGNRRFNRHAQIGAAKARRFLRDMKFSDRFVEETAFLIKEHMLPAHISTLAAYRTEKIMDSPLFPLLLEVYRCDISSSFRGPEGYYQACKTYKRYKKYRKSPYRNTDGSLIWAFENR